jgi:predicted ArsR family transcriptional regulator
VQAVRKRILEILKRRSSATVNELAQELDMAPVSVRYHLDILQGDNLIQVDRVRREGNVGRPQQVYSLTPEASELFPTNFPALTSGLIRELKKALPQAQVDNIFCTLAKEFAQELQVEPTADMDLEERLELVTHFLSERGYFARWERDEHLDKEVRNPGYLLHTYNCPYACVSSEHRELCLMDQEMVNELMGQPCRRVDSLAEDGQCCSYQVAENVQAAENVVVFADAQDNQDFQHRDRISSDISQTTSQAA